MSVYIYINQSIVTPRLFGHIPPQATAATMSWRRAASLAWISAAEPAAMAAFVMTCKLSMIIMVNKTNASS